jgi:hypothetical protein
MREWCYKHDAIMKSYCRICWTNRIERAFVKGVGLGIFVGFGLFSIYMMVGN